MNPELGLGKKGKVALTALAAASVLTLTPDSQVVAQEPGPIVHQVQKGETLASIAREHRVSPTLLLVMNGESDENLSAPLAPGREVVLPNKGEGMFHRQVEITPSTEWSPAKQRLVSRTGRMALSLFDQMGFKSEVLANGQEVEIVVYPFSKGLGEALGKLSGWENVYDQKGAFFLDEKDAKALSALTGTEIKPGVYIRDDLMDRTAGSVETVSHELGHALGIEAPGEPEFTATFWGRKVWAVLQNAEWFQRFFPPKLGGVRQ